MLIPKAEWPDFDAFVAANAATLYRTAYLLTGDRGHAEDLVQTAFLRVAAHWRAAADTPLPYARRVLVNLATDRWRRRYRQPAESWLHQGIEPIEDGVDGQIVLREMLRSLITELPPSQRAVLVLRYFEDLSVAEAASALGCTEGNVKSQTHHALNRLRELMAQSEREPARSQESSNVDR